MDYELMREIEPKYQLKIFFKNEEFIFSETFFLGKGTYTVKIKIKFKLGSNENCDIVLNLPEIDELHANISKIILIQDIEDEDTAEISDFSGITYGISKVNPKNGNKVKIKKNVIYDLTTNSFGLGSYTTIKFISEEVQDLFEINNLHFSFCHENSFSIFGDEEKYKLLFSFVKNENLCLEKNRNLIEISSKIRHIVDQETLVSNKDFQINLQNSENSLNEKVPNSQIEMIDITLLDSNKKKHKNKNDKSYLLKQVDKTINFEEKESKMLRNKRYFKNSESTHKINDNLKASAKKISQNNTLDSDTENLDQNSQKEKKKRTIGLKEIRSLAGEPSPLNSLDNNHNSVSPIKSSEGINSKRTKPLHNYLVYLHEITPDTVKQIIEKSGGKIINDYENKNCIVICEKSDEKFLKRMRRNGISCFSKNLILEGLRKTNTLDFDK